MNIGQAAEQSGLPVKAIRNYEDKGRAGINEKKLALDRNADTDCMQISVRANLA